MKVITILGTRPEIIKLSPLLPLLNKEFEHVLVHTGQHYSWEMDHLFFQELSLRNPEYNLHVGSGNHGEQTGKIMSELEKVVVKEKPEMLIVLGDTNSTLAAALVGSKMGCKVVHLEAGCRSRNRYQPEEINRIVADHCADFLFTIDQESTDNLLNEGFSPEQIFFVGNIVDEACFCVLHMKNGQKKNTDQRKDQREYKIEEQRKEKSDSSNNLIVATIHRAENTDHPERLGKIIEALNILSEKENNRVIFPVHPRTKKVIDEQKIPISSRIEVIKPQGYSAFISLLSQSSLVITDSGGVLEEATFLQVPVLIPREKTELHELVNKGKAFLVRTDTAEIAQAALKQLSQKKEKKELHDPSISQKIINILKTKCMKT